MLGVKMIKNRSEIINYEEGNKYQPFKMRIFVGVTTTRWSPITRYIVFNPVLLSIGGGTHDMCAGIVRQDHTGAHLHALG